MLNSLQVFNTETPTQCGQFLDLSYVATEWRQYNISFANATAIFH